MNYSRAVTLPLVWVRNSDLDKGDKVEMAMDMDGNLILKAVKGEG